MELQSLGALRVVLVETSHPGNIGAVARAMWTMGLERLVLVRPKRFPCAEATARAAGADEILYHATLCDSLAEAVAGCVWVVGSSARQRRLSAPLLAPREWASRARERVAAGEVALVLGREDSGLSNAEMDLCQALVHIPTNPRYSSLNLAAAMQVFAYEYRLAALEDTSVATSADPRDPPAPSEDVEAFYAHLEQTLVEIGYHDADNPRHLMRRLRRLFSRTGLLRSEIGILRGVLAAVGRVENR